MNSPSNPNPILPVEPQFSEEAIIQIWQKAVDTQMHFNEMSAKSRQLGLTFVAAALGVAVLLMADTKDYFMHVPVPYFGWTFHAHVSGLIILAAAAAMLAVRTLDVNVYHKMLRGAVYFGEDFEAKHMMAKLGLQKGMTQAISHFSRLSDAAVTAGQAGYVYTGSKKKSAGDKVRNFYKLALITLLAAASVTFYATHVSYVKSLASATSNEKSHVGATPTAKEAIVTPDASVAKGNTAAPK